MTHKSTTPYHTERRLFFAALSLFWILFGLYVYFISASVVHVIARKEIERQIANVNSRIGELEFAYITARQAIAPTTIAQYGFVAAPYEKIYIEKAPTGLVLADHGTEN